MNSSVLIISAVFPPEPIVSAKLSEDIANGLVEHDIKVIVLHPRPTRPYGFEFNITKKKHFYMRRLYFKLMCVLNLISGEII